MHDFAVGSTIKPRYKFSSVFISGSLYRIDLTCVGQSGNVTNTISLGITTKSTTDVPEVIHYRQIAKCTIGPRPGQQGTVISSIRQGSHNTSDFPYDTLIVKVGKFSQK